VWDTKLHVEELERDERRCCTEETVWTTSRVLERTMDAREEGLVDGRGS
jgi:hypothetical protein